MNFDESNRSDHALSVTNHSTSSTATSASSTNSIRGIWVFSAKGFEGGDENISSEWNTGFATPEPNEALVPLSPKPKMGIETIEFLTPRNELLHEGEAFFTPSSTLLSPTTKRSKQKDIKKGGRMARSQLGYFEKNQL